MSQLLFQFIPGDAVGQGEVKLVSILISYLRVKIKTEIELQFNFPHFFDVKMKNIFAIKSFYETKSSILLKYPLLILQFFYYILFNLHRPSIQLSNTDRVKFNLNSFDKSLNGRIKVFGFIQLRKKKN